jgi:protein-disulfide isomerase
MGGLRSARVPDLLADDHLRGRGEAPLLIEYGDLACPYCAVLHVTAAQLVLAGRVRWVFRHFPSRSARPRAWPLACASEAASLQGRFWEFHDAVLGDQGRIDDPHLWKHATRLGLDLERFERDRRSPVTADRVQRDFDAAVRSGVVATPTVFDAGTPHANQELTALLSRLQP